MDRKQMLQDLLKDRGIAQKKVARALSLSEATISKVVAGRYPLRSVRSRRTRFGVLEYMADLMQLPVAELEARVPQDTEEMIAAASQAA